MICFEHQEMQAVGICKVCNKGLCEKCAVDLGHSLTCAGNCEREAVQLHVQILQNRKSIKSGRSSLFLWPFILFFLGFSILVNEVSRHGFVLNWGSIFGGGLAIISLYVFYIYRNWGMEMDRSESED